MRNIKSEGFGLLGLIIVTAIIAALVFGYQKFGNDKTKNQIEQGQDAIQQAKDAAEAANQSTEYIQNQLQGEPAVNFHGIQNKLKDLNQ